MPPPGGGAGQRGLQPGRGARHQDTERGRRIQSGQVEDDEWRREVEARRRRPVEHAAQVAVHEAAQFQRDVAAVLEQVAPLCAQRAGGIRARGQQGLDHHRHGGGDPGPGGLRQGRAERGTLAGRQAPAQAGAGQRGEELHAPATRRVGAQGPGVGVVGPRVERVQTDRTAGPEGHGADTPRIGQVTVFPLGVDDPGPAPEDRLAPQEGLDERTLAPADLAEDDHVRIGHDAGRVELEGIEHERAAEQVVADHHAPPAEARLRDERIGGAEVPGGHLMGGDPWHPLPHDGERSANRPTASVTLAEAGTATGSRGRWSEHERTRSSATAPRGHPGGAAPS